MTCPKCGSENTIEWGRKIEMCMDCETTFGELVGTVACEVCKRIDVAQQSTLNSDGWIWYSSEAGEYAICPQCEKVRAEQAAIERSKDREHNPKGFTWGS